MAEQTTITQPHLLYLLTQLLSDQGSATSAMLLNPERSQEAKEFFGSLSALLQGETISVLDILSGKTKISDIYERISKKSFDPDTHQSQLTTTTPRGLTPNRQSMSIDVINRELEKVNIEINNPKIVISLKESTLDNYLNLALAARHLVGTSVLALDQLRSYRNEYLIVRDSKDIQIILDEVSKDLLTSKPNLKIVDRTSNSLLVEINHSGVTVEIICKTIAEAVISDFETQLSVWQLMPGDKNSLLDELTTAIQTFSFLARLQDANEKFEIPGSYYLFYKQVLSSLKPDQPITTEQKEEIFNFFEIHMKKLIQLRQDNPDTITQLAEAAHRSYLDFAAASSIKDKNKILLGANIPDEALEILTADARQFYLDRFERFNGSNNKLTLKDLGLHLLSKKQVIDFFNKCGKNGNSIAENLFENDIPKIEEFEKGVAINLYHDDFSTLLNVKIVSQVAKEAWTNALWNSQIGAIAVSSALTEIEAMGVNLNQPVSLPDLNSDDPNSTVHTLREMLTFYIFVAYIRQNSDFADLSYFDFIEKDSWSAQFDKIIDDAIVASQIEISLEQLQERLETAENIFEVAVIKSLSYELQVKKLAIEGYPEEIIHRIRKEIEVELSKLISPTNSPFNSVTTDLTLEEMIQRGIKVDLIISNDNGITRIQKESKFKLLRASDFTDLYQSGRFAKYYQNKVECSAIPAPAGEIVETWIPIGDGEEKYLELTNTTGKDCWIFTGPVGERYILNDEKIRSAYVLKDNGENIPESVNPNQAIELKSKIEFNNDGTPKNARIVMSYEVTEATVVCSTWGTPQVCFPGDYIYFEIGKNELPIVENPMVVARSAFEKSYFTLPKPSLGTTLS